MDFYCHFLLLSFCTICVSVEAVPSCVGQLSCNSFKIALI
jgi:hypothetical protein